MNLIRPRFRDIRYGVTAGISIVSHRSLDHFDFTDGFGGKHVARHPVNCVVDQERRAVDKKLTISRDRTINRVVEAGTSLVTRDCCHVDRRIPLAPAKE